MMNHSCILVLLKTVKKDVKYILVAEQGEVECPYLPSSMQKACMTLVQPVVMADRQPSRSSWKHLDNHCVLVEIL